MALPVILVDSGTGSDTICSGAGPATSLHGTTNAATSSDGLTVTLPASTDLSGVATDGSHVIFLSDSTAGARNFGKITGSAGSGGATPTVTVANAFGINLTSKTWAIGGRLASIGSTTSRKLFENNATSGDALPGWTVELQSAHSETLTTTFNIHRSGDQTGGPITLRGVSGAGTLPLLTFSNNGNAINVNTGIQYIVVQDFELRNSNATKTASVAVTATASGSSFTPNLFRRLKINTAASNFWKGIVTSGSSFTRIDSCAIGNCASSAITPVGYTVIESCYIHDNGADGITFSSTSTYCHLIGNIIARNTGAGFSYTGTGGNSMSMIFGNTIHANTGDGISIGGTLNPFFGLTIQNNNITGNGAGGTGYGINFPGTPAQAALDGGCTIIRNNNFGTGAGVANATGACSLTTAVADTSNVTLDPQYTDATTTNNFTVTNTSAQSIGFPTTNVGNGWTGTRSYVTPGAAQPATGSATYTAASNVRFGTDRGDGVTGTCYVPAAADVRSGTNVDATTGSLVVPAASNVRSGTSVDATTGTCHVPTAANVRYGVAVDATTGTCVLPAEDNVLNAIGFGTAGTEFVGNLVVPQEFDVESGVSYGIFTGTLVVPAEGYVQSGIGYGAAGTEFTGTLTTSGITLGDLQAELTTRGLTSGFTEGTSGGVNLLRVNGTSQTARDLGASVLLSVGSGTGQVNLDSGKVPAKLATADVTGNLPANLTQVGGANIPTPNVSGVPIADIGYVSGESATATPGEIDANVTQWNGSNLATPDVLGCPTVTIQSGTSAGKLSLSSGLVSVVTNNDKTGYSLAPTGLDSISTTAPSGVAGNFREMLVAVWRRFFKKATRSPTELKTYADNGSTVLTTQAISDDQAGNQAQGAST